MFHRVSNLISPKTLNNKNHIHTATREHLYKECSHFLIDMFDNPTLAYENGDEIVIFIYKSGGLSNRSILNLAAFIVFVQPSYRRSFQSSESPS